ncbi:hypothetical protein ACFOD4_04765 [Pseudoroseomonas globiformis]|uniref:Glycosyltransferase 2-like domain-containing protein n=1 Tax=Teichococcus globiformis TaxID=2307229 RepID=A0ABV7FW04_9PROT
MIERLFSFTLRSLLAQTDRNFSVILAAHDVPAAWHDVSCKPGFHLIRADWTPEPPTSANDDGGRKKWLIKQAVRAGVGGLLMFMDADDWVASDLVEKVRAEMRPCHLGAVVRSGFALDYASLRTAPFPIAGAFNGPFHALCGSCTIGRIVATASETHLLDPHEALGSHHEWEARAAQGGFPLAYPATAGLYMVGTGENHSETHGPFARWRRQVTQSVRTSGTLLDPEMARTFGQSLNTLRTSTAG